MFLKSPSLLLLLLSLSTALPTKPCLANSTNTAPAAAPHPPRPTGSLTFDGEPYTMGWKIGAGGSQLQDYFLPKEGPQNWTQMIRLELHPATEPPKTLHSYLSAYRPFISLRPQRFKNPDKSHAAHKDTIIQMGLGRPSLTPQFEFVTSRFLATSGGVLGITHTLKIPFSSKPHTPLINLQEPKKKNQAWRRELFTMSPESLLKEFSSQNPTHTKSYPSKKKAPPKEARGINKENPDP